MFYTTNIKTITNIFCDDIITISFSTFFFFFLKVVNRNRDFYADIAKGAIPYYDILLTNPPYSGDHKTLLLKYLLTSSLKKNELAR